MAAVSASLCWTLLLVGVFVFVSAKKKILISAKSGQDVTLTCRAPNNDKITSVKWCRFDLRSGCALLYDNGHFSTALQHPSFRNRVDLQDRQMKDGDVSMILKDVTINDEGTYDCAVFMEGPQSWNLISIINLRVVPPGQPGGLREGGRKEDGSDGLADFPVIQVLVLLVAVLGFVIYKRQNRFLHRHR